MAFDTDNARSSTASHYAKNFETVSAGFAAHDFYQVILDNNIWDAPAEQLVGVAVLVAVLIWTTPPSSRGAAAALAVTVVILCVTALPAVTVVPLLTTVVYTRTTYPYAVVIPHCIVAHCSYRSQFGDSANRLQALLACFFLYGFGGSLVADVAMGVPATALGHARIVPCHVLGWCAVWFCPADYLFRAYTRQVKHSYAVRVALVAAEAVDAVTTPMGRIARAARELQNHTTAPLMAGLLVGTGGAVVRWLAAGIGTWATLEAAVWRTVGYSVLFWSLAVLPCTAGWYTDPDVHHCAAYSGSDALRVVMVTAHVVWTCLADMQVVSGQHPFVWMGYQIQQQGAAVAAVLRCGPPSITSSESKKKD